MVEQVIKTDVEKYALEILITQRNGKNKSMLVFIDGRDKWFPSIVEHSDDSIGVFYGHLLMAIQRDETVKIIQGFCYRVKNGEKKKIKTFTAKVKVHINAPFVDACINQDGSVSII